MTHYQMENLMAELETLPTRPGLLMTELLELPETTRQFLQWILRRKEVEIKEIAETIQQTESNTHTLITRYIQYGMLEHVDQADGDYYRVRMHIHTANLHHTHRKDIWKALDESDSSNIPEPPKS